MIYQNRFEGFDIRDDDGDYLILSDGRYEIKPEVTKYIKSLQDQLRRRNMQIKDLKKQIENLKFNGYK